ncbi:MAG: DUF992 domain-containing protein [Pseudomonadota bacterium]
MKTTLGTLALAAGLAAMPLAPSANAASIELGTLSCSLTGETNLVVYSTQQFDCTFDRYGGDKQEYSGQIQQLGVDLEFNNTLVIKWAVFAPSRSGQVGILSGNYVGAAASASLGVGAGGKVLVGGSQNSISLQPISVEGSTGAGADLGIERFKLEHKG